LILKFKKKYRQNRREKLRRTMYFSADSEFHATTLLYIELTTDILPRAPWNSCEEIFRIKNTRFNLLKTQIFLWPLP
jgi:hypothetical protein